MVLGDSALVDVAEQPSIDEIGVVDWNARCSTTCTGILKRNAISDFSCQPILLKI
jgi:hypothetical protein